MYDFEIEQKRQVDLWQTYHRRNVLERDLFIRKVHSIRAEKMVPNIRNEVLTWKLEQLIVTTLDRRGRHYKSQV